MREERGWYNLAKRQAKTGEKEERKGSVERLVSSQHIISNNNNTNAKTGTSLFFLFLSTMTSIGEYTCSHYRHKDKKTKKKKPNWHTPQL